MIAAELQGAPWMSLHRLPAKGPAVEKQPGPLVLLHGWGANSRVFDPLVAHLDGAVDMLLVDLPGFASARGGTLEDLLEGLRQYLPERCVLLGWSLGGMVASRYADRYPQRVAGLITLASNLCFVARPDWPSAMADTVFRQFYDSFRQRPALALQRFDGLQAQGDKNARPVLKWLRQYRREGSGALEGDWRGALELLAGIDNRHAFAALSSPGLHLLGEGDALVPAAVAGDMTGLNPSQVVKVLPGAGHALQLTAPQLVAAEVKAFLQGLATAPRDNRKYRLDKNKVAESFSRAAATYDGAAGLQRQVGEQLLRRLPAGYARGDEGALLLDLGCGTGYFTRALAARDPGVRVVGLDIAQGMLEFACRHSAPDICWVGGDAESLPLADNSVDGVFSSLAIQWCEQLAVLFRELRRVLRPGGQVALATLGPDTLHELRRAWNQVDDYAHVNRFAPREDLDRALREAGFDTLHWQRETRVMHYGEVRELTRELKALGAHNMNAGQSAGLTGRRRIQRFVAAYEQFRREGRLPASYEVYYVVAS